MSTEQVFVRLVACAVVAAAILAPAAGDVKLPAIIGDNMVLQRDARVPIWGTAAPGERVTVRIGKQRKSTVADADGKWRVTLSALKAGGPYEMTITGKNTITLRNVLAGEVWVCSGQSNMQWSVRNSNDAQQEIAAANYPEIRLFGVKLVAADTPQSDTEGHWVECSSATVPDFSAVGYFFGRDLYKALRVPIGLINSSWGGTPAEAWTSRETLEADAEYKPMLERWDAALADLPNIKGKWDADMAQWQQEADKAKAEGKAEPAKPNPPWVLNKSWQPAALFNGMIAPLIPYAIKGAIWYQGESNAGRAYQYRKLFPAMIEDWRRAWGERSFPFLFVQLANFLERKAEPGESAWAELREAQTMTLSLPKTGMAIIIDVGDAADIHPKNKQDVGLRLALAAERIAYGRDVVDSGPMYRSMAVEGNKIRLRFKDVDGGLTARGGPPLKGFAIAGEDRKFVWAQAAIDGDAVVVSSDQVAKPVAVRYAWADNPECNLYNKAGLPASPFRTDDWPGVTVNNH